MSAAGRRFSAARLRKLVDYVSFKLGPLAGVRAVMFTVWQCDMESYLATGKSITGAEWVKGMLYPIPRRPEEGQK